MKKPIILISFILLASMQMTASASQTYGSQILMAQKAKLVVIGDVVYLGKVPPIFTTALHLNHQVVVFRVRTVLKGSYREQFIRVNFSFGIDSPGLSESAFSINKSFILLLESREVSKACLDQEQATEFKRYLNFPCYKAWPEAAIRANKDEVAAFKWIIKNK